MEISVEPSKTYAVTTSGSCTVTDADGLELCTASSGSQAFFVATTPTVTISDDGAKVSRATFNHALAVAGLLGGGDNLPAGYTRVEFLESNGSAYVDTGLTVTPSTGVRYKVWQDSDSYMVLAGNMEHSSDTAIFCPLISYQGRVGVNIGGPLYLLPDGGYASGGSAAVSGNAFVVKDEELVGEVNWRNDGQLLFKAESFTEHRPLPKTLQSWYGDFYIGTQGSIKINSYRGRMYHFDISEGARVVKKLVPALDPNGIPGWFDLATKQPLANIGTEPFIAGMTLAQVRALRLPAGGGQLTLSLPHEASVDRLAQDALERARANGWTLTLQYAEAEVPAGYRKLEFLESTGTQYINTGITLSNESEVQCECLIPEGNTSNPYLYGAKEAYKVNDFSFFVNTNDGYGTFIIGESSPRILLKLGGKVKIIQNRLKCAINEEERAINSVLAFETPPPFTLFCLRWASYIKARMYSFSISRAGEMQVDYVPCIAPDGKLGMFNKVDGTLQENTGRGAFIAGLATVDDVRKLWLTETGGELTVSVPADTPDSAVEQLRKNNPTWQIAIQFRTDNEDQ